MGAAHWEAHLDSGERFPRTTEGRSGETLINPGSASVKSAGRGDEWLVEAGGWGSKIRRAVVSLGTV